MSAIAALQKRPQWFLAKRLDTHPDNIDTYTINTDGTIDFTLVSGLPPDNPAATTGTYTPSTDTFTVA